MQLSIIRRNILVEVDLQWDTAFSAQISGNCALFSSPFSFSLSLCASHIPGVQVDAKDWCPAQRHCHLLPSVFPKHGLCLAVSIPPGTEGKDKFSLFTWLGATSCPGMCSCISSCIECSGTSVLLCEVTVSAQTGGNSLQTLCPCRVLLCPFFTVQTFHRGKAVNDPFNKAEERGNFLPFSSTAHLKCRNICNRTSYFEFNHFQPKLLGRNESNIGLELLYMGLTNNSSAKKCS